MSEETPTMPIVKPTALPGKKADDNPPEVDETTEVVVEDDGQQPPETENEKTEPPVEIDPDTGEVVDGDTPAEPAPDPEPQPDAKPSESVFQVEPEEPSVDDIVEKAVQERLKPITAQQETQKRIDEINRQRRKLADQWVDADAKAAAAWESSDRAEYEKHARLKNKAEDEAEALKKELEQLQEGVFDPAATAAPVETTPAPQENMPSPKEMELFQGWVAKNPWFNQKKKFNKQIRAALRISREVAEAGIGMDDPDHYKEVEQELASMFPNMVNPHKSRQTAAGQTAEPVFHDQQQAAAPGSPTTTPKSRAAKKSLVKIPRETYEYAVKANRGKPLSKEQQLALAEAQVEIDELKR